MALSENFQICIAGFAKIDRIDPCGEAYGKLCDILDRCDDNALKVVHAANIKFVSNLALNRMIQRGLVPTI